MTVVIIVLLDLERAFDSVDHARLCSTLRLKVMVEMFGNLLRRSYSHACGHQRVYSESPSSFPTICGVRQGFPLSPSLFNFVIGEVLENAVGGIKDAGVELADDEKL